MCFVLSFDNRRLLITEILSFLEQHQTEKHYRTTGNDQNFVYTRNLFHILNFEFILWQNVFGWDIFRSRFCLITFSHVNEGVHTQRIVRANVNATEDQCQTLKYDNQLLSNCKIIILT